MNSIIFDQSNLNSNSFPKDIIIIYLKNTIHPLSISLNSMKKIINQSKISIQELNYINFKINLSLNKKELQWEKLHKYKIYFGIFGFDSCIISVKDIKKISSMIFKSYKSMIPYIKISIRKNALISNFNTLNSLNSDKFNYNSSNKSESSINPLLNPSSSIELIEVTDINNNIHKVLKENLNYAIEKINKENINLNNIVINFYDFPNYKLFPINKKWLKIDKQEIKKSIKKHYLISIARIKLKNIKI